jgi:hypothetical protein
LDDNQLNSTTGGSGSINKLHACLSGLSRGSQASYGSLASFNDGRSLYHAMAPQSFLLSNLTRQRERRKINKKLNKKKNKKNKKKRNRKKKSDDSEPEKKRRKKTIIALPKDCFTSNSTESIKSSKKTKKALKPKKPKKTKKLKVLDAAAQAAQASAELVNAPINPDCPEFLKSKFGKIYNNFGRVGIYTPSQRLIIMNRYRLKRTNRVWKKVVRYDCRKNLADTRLRIKGRFVRRDSEEAKIYFANLKKDLVSFQFFFFYFLISPFPGQMNLILTIIVIIMIIIKFRINKYHRLLCQNFLVKQMLEHQRWMIVQWE